MERRPLGRTGVEVSILGLGGFHLVEIRARDVEALIGRYVAAGGNYVETAAMYGDGESEIKVGRALKGRRKDCLLATKVWERQRGAAQMSIQRSLKYLDTDHVDVLFVHAVQTREELDTILGLGGAVEALEAARQAGQARFIGISGHGQPDTLIAAVKSYPFDVLMTNFNYFDRFNYPAIENEMVPLGLEKGLSLIGMKALADGYLWRSAPAAFRYAWSLPIATMVAGFNTMEMLEQDLSYAESFRPMTEEEKEGLFFNAPELGNYICRLCDKCLPCPEGINIPNLFRLEGIYDQQMWDGVMRDPADYALRDRLRFWFAQQDLARQLYAQVDVKADVCTDCGECEPRCPYHLPIVRKLNITHYKLTGKGVM